jgi:hypothetical protein
LSLLNDNLSQSDEESNTLASLSERTADMTEDIEERVEITKAILAEEDGEAEVEQTQVVGEEETLE